MKVAIFTDNDFGKVNGVTTSLKAALRHAPEGIQPRVYTACDEAENRPDYFAARSIGMAAVSYTHLTLPTNREV